MTLIKYFTERSVNKERIWSIAVKDFVFIAFVFLAVIYNVTSLTPASFSNAASSPLVRINQALEAPWVGNFHWEPVRDFYAKTLRTRLSFEQTAGMSEPEITDPLGQSLTDETLADAERNRLFVVRKYLQETVSGLRCTSKAVSLSKRSAEQSGTTEDGGFLPDQELPEAVPPEISVRDQLTDQEREWLDRQIRECREELLLDDVFRVTFSNLKLVVVYAVLILVLTSRLKWELCRKWFDSIYFYGFILTLLALIVALSNVSRYSGIALSTIVVQNAIALSSTITALTMRTLFVNLIPGEEPDTDDELEAVNDELRVLARNLNEISQSTLFFNDRLKSVETTIGGTADMVTTEASRVVSGLKDKADDLSNVEIDQKLLSAELAKAVDLALGQLSTEIESVRASIAGGSQSITDELAGVHDKVGNLNTSLSDAHETTTATVEAASKAVEEMMGAGVSGATSIQDATQNVADRLADLDLAPIITERFAQLMDDAASQISTEQNALKTAVDDLLSMVQDSADGYSNTLATVEALQQRATQNADKLEKLSSAFDALTLRANGTFADPKWTTQHSQTLGNLQNTLEEVNESLVKVKSDLNTKPITMRKLWAWLFFRKG